MNKYPFLLCSSVEVVGILSDRGLPGPRAIQVHFQELLLHKEALQIHFNKVFIKLSTRSPKDSFTIFQNSLNDFQEKIKIRTGRYHV